MITTNTRGTTIPFFRVGVPETPLAEILRLLSGK